MTRSSHEDLSNENQNNNFFNQINSPLKLKLQTERNFNFISSNLGSNTQNNPQPIEKLSHKQLIGSIGNILNTEPREYRDNRDDRYIIKENNFIGIPTITEQDYITLHKVANSLEKIPYINNNTYYNNFNIVNNYQSISEKDAKELLLKKQSFKKYGSSANFDTNNPTLSSLKKNMDFNLIDNTNLGSTKTKIKDNSSTQYKFYPSNTSARTSINTNNSAKKGSEKDIFSTRTKTPRISLKSTNGHIMVTSASVESLGGAMKSYEREKLETATMTNKKVLSSNSNMIERIIDGIRQPIKPHDIVN